MTKKPRTLMHGYNIIKKKPAHNGQASQSFLNFPLSNIFKNKRPQKRRRLHSTKKNLNQVSQVIQHALTLPPSLRQSQLRHCEGNARSNLYCVDCFITFAMTVYTTEDLSLRLKSLLKALANTKSHP